MTGALPRAFVASATGRRSLLERIARLHEGERAESAPICRTEMAGGGPSISGCG